MGKKGKKIEKKPEVAKSGKNLFRVNRSIKTISKSSMMLLCAHDEKQFMRDVCHNIVETGGFRLAWIGFAENDKKKSVRPMAQYGFEEGYLDGINLTWADEDIGHGPTGTCIRTGKPVISKNILKDPAMAPWRESAVKRGYASSASLPLYHEKGKAIGALMVYATEPDAFDGEELELLMELAADAAYGITMIRMKKEHDAAVNELKNSYEKLKEVDSLKSGFISMVSHELRTPLTIIKGFNSFLMKDSSGTLNEIQRNFVNVIDLNVARLGRIINDMVDISIIESGKFTIEKKPHDIISVLSEAMYAMQGIARENEVSLEKDFRLKSAVFQMDKGRIQQAISNLIINAVRFSPKGGIVSVSFDRADKNRLPVNIRKKMAEKLVYYSLCVTDNGAGIEKANLEIIFERFFKVDKTAYNRHHGVGLGLSITKNIIEAHDGFIWAESEGLGKGARIYVVLPAQEK
jgi:signal transduction histidine kinase